MKMNIESFITSPSDIKASERFRQVALTKTLTAYDQGIQRRNWKVITRLIFGATMAAALCLVVFLRVGVPLHTNSNGSDKSDIAQMDQETQTLEHDISQDPVLTQAMQ